MVEFVIKYWVGIGFGAIMTVLGAVYRKFQWMHVKYVSSELALRALLRDKIITVYNKYSERGSIPIYELESLDDMFKQYKNLGGNGIITELVERIENLPITK